MQLYLNQEEYIDSTHKSGIRLYISEHNTPIMSDNMGITVNGGQWASISTSQVLFATAISYSYFVSKRNL